MNDKTKASTPTLSPAERSLLAEGKFLVRKGQYPLETVVPLTHVQNGHPLFCFPSISGRAGDFSDMAKHIGSDVRLIAVQASSELRNSGTSPSIEVLAGKYLDAILEFQKDSTGRIKPFSLLGWSAGGVLALDVARQASALGHPPGLLAIVDTELANSGARMTSRKSPLFFIKLAANFPSWLAHESQAPNFMHDLARRASNKISASFHRTTGNVGGEIAQGAHPLRGIQDARKYTVEHWKFMEALYDAAERYSPLPYPTSPVVVYDAQTGPLTRLKEVGKAWREVAPHAEILPIGGTHLSVNKAPAVAHDLRRRILALPAAETIEPTAIHEGSALGQPAKSWASDIAQAGSDKERNSRG